MMIFGSHQFAFTAAAMRWIHRRAGGWRRSPNDSPPRPSFDWTHDIPELPLSTVVSGDQPAGYAALRREFGITEKQLMEIDKADIERRVRAEVARELADAQAAIADAEKRYKVAEQEVRRVRDLMPRWAKTAMIAIALAGILGWTLFFAK